MARAEKYTKLISNRPGFIQINVEFLLQKLTRYLTAPQNSPRSTLVDYFVELLKEYLFCNNNQILQNVSSIVNKSNKFVNISKSNKFVLKKFCSSNKKNIIFCYFNKIIQ